MAKRGFLTTAILPVVARAGAGGQTPALSIGGDDMSEVMMGVLQSQVESLTRQVEKLGPENERVRKLLTEFDLRHEADQAEISRFRNAMWPMLEWADFHAADDAAWGLHDSVKCQLSIAALRNARSVLLSPQPQGEET